MGDAGLPASLQQALDGTKVGYKQLGRSGLRLSVPIFGCMSFGHRDWQPWVMDNEEEVLKLLKGAWDVGLNSWDTANVYSNGVSEVMIGKAIKKFNLPRNKLVLLTKCFGTVGEEPAVVHMKYNKEMMQTKDYINQGGLSRQAIFNAVDASLERLQTGYIDLLQIHRFDATVPIEETMKALHDLVQSGKVRYIGASSMWAYQFAQMQFCAERNGWTKFVSMQNHYSLCYREEEREMNKFCHDTGVGLIPWAPLYRGYLARPVGNAETERSESLKSNPMMPAVLDADIEIIKRVQELAEKKDWKMSQVSLAWIVQQNTIPIVGFSSIARINEAADIKGKVLTEDECKYLEEPYKPRAISGHN